MKPSFILRLKLLLITSSLSLLTSCEKEEPPQPIMPMYGVNAALFTNLEDGSTDVLSQNVQTRQKAIPPFIHEKAEGLE